MSAPAGLLRVVRVIGLLEPGGAQLSAFRLTRALRWHGITSRLIAGEATPAGLGLARSVRHFVCWGPSILTRSHHALFIHGRSRGHTRR